MGPRNKDGENTEVVEDEEPEDQAFENSGQAYAADLDEVYGEASDIEDEPEEEEDEQ